MGARSRTVAGVLRAPFGEALSAELLRLELLATRGWQVLSGVGLIGSIAIAIWISRPLGVGAAITCAFFVVWFTYAASHLRRGRAHPGVVAFTALVEIVSPWAFETVLAITEGPEYALGSWVPPMIFCGLIVASTVRLRPWPPLLQGISSACAYLALYFFFVRGALRPETAGFVLYRPGMQISRATTLLLAGGLGTLLAIGLRNAIGRADATVREQDLFGKYRLLRVIAAGGMGVVHEALYCPEGGFERRVAVKRIHPHLSEERAFVEAFRAEAELCAHLSHPNVVGVFDFGRVGGVYFLAMEYVDGLTLSALIARAFEAKMLIPLDVVRYVGRELCAALVYSHEVSRGAAGERLRVVHRDLCPQNVLISIAGEVKITDFGIARALRESAAMQTRALRGHAAYMAPEQLRGLPLTPQCDLFAVGAILWELVAGRRLFSRATEAATLAAILSEPIVPVSAIRPEVDPAWDTFFSRALANDPDDRFAFAAEMKAALDDLPGPAIHGGRSAETLAAMIVTLREKHAREELPPDEVPTTDVSALSRNLPLDQGNRA